MHSSQSRQYCSTAGTLVLDNADFNDKYTLSDWYLAKSNNEYHVYLTTIEET